MIKNISLRDQPRFLALVSPAEKQELKKLAALAGYLYLHKLDVDLKTSILMSRTCSSTGSE